MNTTIMEQITTASFAQLLAMYDNAFADKGRNRKGRLLAMLDDKPKCKRGE